MISGYVLEILEGWSYRDINGNMVLKEGAPEPIKALAKECFYPPYNVTKDGDIIDA